MSQRWCKSAAQSLLAPLVIEGALLLYGTVLWNVSAPYAELSRRYLRKQKLRARFRDSARATPDNRGVLARTWWSGNYFVTCGFDGESCSAVVPDGAVQRIAA